MKSSLTFLILFLSLNNSLFSQNAELCSPYALSVFGGNQENVISWAEASNVGCGNYLVSEMPYSHVGSNTGMGDNWNVAASDGEDVSYTLTVSEATTYDITLCSESTDFDTKLEIFTLNGDDCDSSNATSTGNYNDDFTCEFSSLQSSLLGVTLQPGQYYVVVDGFAGSTGNYGIAINVTGNRTNDITSNSVRDVWAEEELKMINLGFSQEIIDFHEAEVMNPYRYARRNNLSRDVPEECGTFTCYRVYDAETNVVLACTEELSFTHGGLTNGTEYCYYITALYDEGESELSQTVCATPSFFEPAPPTNVYAEVWYEEISIYWTEPSVNTLGVPYYESFDDGGLLDLWLVEGTNWIYNESSGNPAPAFQFYWNPSEANYDQSLYSPIIPLGELTEVMVSFDLLLNDFDTQTDFENFAIEYKTGNDIDWTQLQSWSSNGDFDFTNFSYNLTGLSNNLFVRFRCYGATTFDIDWWEVDNFAVVSEGRESRNEYDFLGYNVYLDGVLNNTSIFDTTGYTVYGLNNEIEYTLGVTSVYEGAPGESNYESAPVNVIAQPIYVYGDVTGTISDPNGALLEGVVVLSGAASDTTGTDGVYTLYNLDVGVNTIQVNSSGFYNTTADVQVLAQADPTQQDFVLSPDMPHPGGLDAHPLDEQVYLEWRQPGSGEELFFQYDDGVLANATFFFETFENGQAHGVRFDVGGGFDVLAASVKILSEGDMFWPWPNSTHGPVRVLIFDDISGQPGNLLHDEEATAQDGWATVYPNVSGLEGSFYVIATHAEDWTDTEGFGIDSGLDYAENMVTYFDGEWNFGDAGYGGDYMMAAQVMSYGGGMVSMSSTNETNQSFSNFDQSLVASTISLTPTGSLNEPSQPVFNPVTTTTSLDREDVLVEYRVYEVGDDGTETFVVATQDTFITLDASPNYIDYCYNISAYWSTEDYGELESRHSNVSCTVPYAPGDADFDSNTDINDVLTVVDFILEEDYPTEDEFRNVDVNMDGDINIADIIMMVDIIFSTTTARLVDFDPNEVAYIDLKSDYSSSVLLLEIEYNGPIRGMEFELNYDSELLDIQTPYLMDAQGNVMISSNMVAEGKKKVIVSDMQGGTIKPNGKTYLSIPVEFKGSIYDIGQVEIENINVAGFAGDLIDYVSRSAISEVKLIPHDFSLQQNFPNPFNPSTEIRFDLPEEGHVELSVFNMQGQKVKTLESSKMTPGYHAIVWNGTNDTGSRVSTGMYFYSIQTNKFKAVKKMLFLK